MSCAGFAGTGHAFEQIENGGATVYVIADGALDWHEWWATTILTSTVRQVGRRRQP